MMEQQSEFYLNGNLKWKGTYLNNQLHSFEDEPAFIFYNEDGSLLSKSWYIKGINIRENYNNPSSISYNSNGMIKKEIFYNNNGHKIRQKLYFNNGKNKEIFNYYKNELHAFGKDENGLKSAYTYYGTSGSENKLYFIYGTAVTQKKYERYLYYFENKIISFQKRKQKKVSEVLLKTKMVKQGKDICKLISLFC